MLKSQAYFKKN